VVSILPTSKTPRRSEQDLYGMSLRPLIHFPARSHQGFRARLKGLARAVAVVIGLSLSIASMPRLEASIDANQSLKLLANKQLTDKQYKCHNSIVFRESSWNINARSGSHYGYYQMRSKYMKDKPYDFQFYLYWYYVASRYGFSIENPEVPNYCAAFNHLKRKGWQ
jgi:hypothetical protein